MTTLVVTDLDGTLWDTTVRCHPAVIEAVEQLIAADDVVLLAATGRRRNSTRRSFLDNGFLLPAVLLNGALGFDFVADEMFHEQAFAPADLARVLDLLQVHLLSPVAYLSDNRVLVAEGVTSSIEHLDSLGDDLVWSAFEALVSRRDVVGLSMLGVEPDLVRPAFEVLTHLSGVQAAAYADGLYPPYSLMLTPENITKEAGIRAYCAYRGLTPDRIVALGDGGNDLEMLAMADIALVVDGGDSRALALADHVIGRPEVGGFAAVLDWL